MIPPTGFSSQPRANTVIGLSPATARSWNMVAKGIFRRSPVERTFFHDDRRLQIESLRRGTRERHLGAARRVVVGRQGRLDQGARDRAGRRWRGLGRGA